MILCMPVGGYSGYWLLTETRARLKKRMLMEQTSNPFHGMLYDLDLIFDSD